MLWPYLTVPMWWGESSRLQTFNILIQFQAITPGALIDPIIFDQHIWVKNSYCVR